MSFVSHKRRRPSAPEAISLTVEGMDRGLLAVVMLDTAIGIEAMAVPGGGDPTRGLMGQASRLRALANVVRP